VVEGWSVVDRGELNRWNRSGTSKGDGLLEERKVDRRGGRCRKGLLA
jgi:hypothetical protein